MSYNYPYSSRKKLSTKFKDYTGHGRYFITLVCHCRKRILSRIDNKTLELTDAGHIVERIWRQIPEKFIHVRLGESVIMPDHFHGIIKITQMPDSDLVSLGQVVHWFKTWTTNEYHKYGNRTGQYQLGKLWQRGYNESWIPKGSALSTIEKYIRNNPKNWQG